MIEIPDWRDENLPWNERAEGLFFHYLITCGIAANLGFIVFLFFYIFDI